MMELFTPAFIQGLGFWSAFFLIALVVGILGMLLTGFEEA